MSTTTETTMSNTTVTSADGTEIAFERTGDGPAVILVPSALADRSDTQRLAKLLAENFTVINYDRRGRGASSDTQPYAVEREIEDIAALVEHAGGSASLFGSSSGAVLALRAAAQLNIDRVVVYEPPFVVDREDDFGPSDGFAQRIDELLAADQRTAAVTCFMTEAQGMPKLFVRMMRLMPGVWKKLTALAHTLRYDIRVMADTQQGKPLSVFPWSAVEASTLVLVGGATPAGMHRAAQHITAVLPNAEHRVLDGLNHGAAVTTPKKLAPSVAEFLRR